MTFRIQTSIDKESVTFWLSGKIDPEGSIELQRQMQRGSNGHRIVLDLGDIQLVDRYAVKLLAACENTGIELRNCPAYIRDWMLRENKQQKTRKEDKKMNNILVATFNDDKTAIEAMHKLYQLDRQDDVEVFNHVLLKKNSDGTFEYLKDEREPDGWGTLTGMLLGTFIGIVGGPVGMLAGFFGGMTLGAVTDAFRYSFDYDFMENFKQGLPVGTTTLIAEVTEPSTVFVNDAFAPFGTVVWRSNVYTEQDRYFQTQVDALDAEIDQANKDLEAAVDEEKAAIQAKLNELKVRRDAKIAEINADIQDDIESLKTSVENLKHKIQGKIDEARRNHLEAKLKREEELIKKFEGRAAKLNAEIAKYKTASNA